MGCPGSKDGYCWKVSNGIKIRFWEDSWLGSSSLAIQYWKLYRIVNEKNNTIAEIWDGGNLKCTFRRTIMLLWRVCGGRFTSSPQLFPLLMRRMP